MSDSPVDKIKSQALEASVAEVLRTVYDPELPVNIYDLGLVYGIEATAEGEVTVQMTLTTPACPVAGILPQMAEARIKDVAGVTSAEVKIVWDPPWDRDMMSDAAKLQLGLDVEIPKGERLSDFSPPYD